jgi:hypothetical protein
LEALAQEHEKRFFFSGFLPWRVPVEAFDDDNSDPWPHSRYRESEVTGGLRENCSPRHSL